MVGRLGIGDWGLGIVDWARWGGGWLCACVRWTLRSERRERWYILRFGWIRIRI